MIALQHFNRINWYEFLLKTFLKSLRSQPFELQRENCIDLRLNLDNFCNWYIENIYISLNHGMPYERGSSRLTIIINIDRLFY